MSQPAKTPPILLVRDDDAKKSDLWNKTAKNRFFKQHGDVEELPENDAHAVKKYHDPTSRPKASAEETKAAEHSLEEKIKALKTSEKKPQPAPKLPKNDFYDNWTD